VVGNPFGHQGLSFDYEGHSYQNRRREYAPELQRFSGRDPASSSVNLYSPYRACPVFSVDPDGLAPKRSWPQVPRDQPCPLGWRDCGSEHCMCFITNTCCVFGSQQSCCGILTPFCCDKPGDDPDCCSLIELIFRRLERRMSQ